MALLDYVLPKRAATADLLREDPRFAEYISTTGATQLLTETAIDTD